MAVIRNLMLKLGMEVDEQGATKGISKLEGLFEKASGVVGIAGGVALGAGFVKAMDLSASRGKIQAQLGVTAEESKRIGDVAGKLFASAYGDSMEEVSDAVTSVVRNIDGMRTASSAVLEATTGRALTLSKVMGEDVGKATEAVSQIMRTGLAKDSKEAFDILTRGAQLGVDKSHDLLDTFIEYPTQFRVLGISAQESMGLLNQGLLAGARNSDVVADALKEFAIRAVDGSKLTAEGFEMIGLNHEIMADKIARGGKTAKEALDLTLDRIRAMPDPVMKSQAAVALFGTKSEDMAKALYSLDVTTAVKSLGQVEGAADRAGQAFTETAAARLESFKRSVEANVVRVLDGVVSAFGKLPTSVQNGLIQFSTAALLIAPVTLALVKARQAMVAFIGTSVGSSIVSRFTSVFDSLRLRTMYAADAFRQAQGPVAKFRTVLGGISGVASRARSAIGGAVAALGGPWGIAIAGGIAALAIFASRNKESEERVRGLTEAIREDSGVLGENTRAKVVNELESSGALRMAQRLGIDYKLVTDAALGNTEAIRKLNDQLSHYNIQADSSALGSTKLKKGYQDLQIDAGQLRSIIFGANGEIKESVEAFNRTSAAMGKTSRAIDPVVSGNENIARSADNATDKTGALIQQLSKFRSMTGDADLAAIDFKESLDRLSTSMNKNNTGINKRTGLFNLNTKAGRDNNRMLIDAIRNASNHSQKLVDEGKSVDFANKAFKRQIDDLKGVLRQKGLTRKEIDKLINKYVEMKNDINKATNGIKDRKVRIEVKAGGELIGYKVQGGTLLKAQGGVLPGYTPGRDVHYFHSSNGMTLGLSGGEAVMRPEFTRGVGKQWVDQMNYIARTGGAKAVAKALGPHGSFGPGNKKLGAEGMFFRGGGIIHEGSITGVSSVKKMAERANSLYQSWSRNIGTSISKFFTEMLGIGGPRVQKALRWAKSQAGKPYIWGGVGPGGYDCSGFMSAIWNVIKGKSPYSRVFSTHGFGARTGPGGFVRNAQSGFKVGVTHAGVGHMAGTLGRTNVESRGSAGVVVGSRARGFNNGLFPYQYGLRMDNGGVLKPKTMTAVYNGTNEPEYAIPHRFLSGNQDGGDTFNITVNAGMGTDSRELEKAVYTAIKKYKSRNGRSLTV